MQLDQQRHYRQQLDALQLRLRGESEQMVEYIREQSPSEDEISTLRTHTADQDTEGIDREIAIEGNREHILQAVQEALLRIEHGTFGQCETCGTEIAAARLDAIPYAARCIECERSRTGT